MMINNSLKNIGSVEVLLERFAMESDIENKGIPLLEAFLHYVITHPGVKDETKHEITTLGAEFFTGIKQPPSIQQVPSL